MIHYYVRIKQFLNELMTAQEKGVKVVLVSVLSLKQFKQLQEMMWLVRRKESPAQVQRIIFLSEKCSELMSIKCSKVLDGDSITDGSLINLL